MLSLLKQPFPARSLTAVIRMAALIGLFVAVFLLVFQPFGMREAPAGTAKFVAIAGYGLVTFGCISLSALLLSRLEPAWFKPETWTVGKEIFITLFNFLLIGFFNTVYTFYIFGQPFSLRYILYFQVITLAVGIIPVSVIVLLRHNRLLSQNLKLAREMNSELGTTEEETAIPAKFSKETGQSVAGSFTFASETGTETLTFTQNDFLFATAADNYVELHFLEKGATRKSLIRNTLTRLEENVKTDPKIVRCHRAYLVNLHQVRNFSGNAQGLKLELHGTPELIPVSRKMVPEIKTLLHG